MTREELFDRYVADTLDDEATAELEALLTGDEEFAAQFAADLLATGAFEEVEGEVRRIEPGAGEAGHPKLLTGQEAGRSDFSLQPGRKATGPVHRVPPPPPATAASPRTGQPGVTSPPPASSMPPPAPPAPAPPIPYQGGRGGGGLYGGHHEQPVLRSAQQRSPVVAIVVMGLLVVGIGVALFVGLTREKPVAEAPATGVARVLLVDGMANLTRDLGKLKVEADLDLMAGDVLEVGQGMVRIAYFNEKTYLHVGAGTQIRFEDHGKGKAVRLAMGELTVEATSQPASEPMVITTDQASVTLTGTKAALRAVSGETFVEVLEGSVEVERKSDSERVKVAAGAWAAVGSEGPLRAWEFVAAVNLNGEAEDIDGNRWLSFAEAQQQGLKVAGIEREAEKRTSVETPKGGGAATGLSNMLMSSVAAKSDRLSLTWPQPNGQYQIFVWFMEHEGDQVRSLRLNVEEKLVADELGKKQLLGEWQRFGPFPATITDGALDLLMSADAKFQSHDPHLSGLAVYRRAGSVPGEEEGDGDGPAVESPEGGGPAE